LLARCFNNDNLKWVELSTHLKLAVPGFQSKLTD
jgi:hypothetical protein